MENSVSRPDTVNKLRFAADAAFAMLAGMQLGVFTPLRNGAMTADELGQHLVSLIGIHAPHGHAMPRTQNSGQAQLSPMAWADAHLIAAGSLVVVRASMPSILR